MTDGRSGGLPYNFFDSPVCYVSVTKFSAGPDQTHRSCYAQLIGCGFYFWLQFIDPSDWWSEMTPQDLSIPDIVVVLNHVAGCWKIQGKSWIETAQSTYDVLCRRRRLEADEVVR
jgi:hypothetical protein